MAETLASGTPRKIRVLVVDDSAFMRYLIARELGAEPDIEVAGTARDGLDALAKVAELRPDVVTMDIEMPKMDGLTALERIMADHPTPVILLSTLTHEGAAVTIRGLELGAVDFVTKPTAVEAAASAPTWHQLSSRIRATAGLDIRRLGYKQHGFESPRPAATARCAMPSEAARPTTRPDGVVVIGTSTGGPRALFSVVPRLPAHLRAGVLVVQHMPPGFTRSLAGRLNDVSELEVREAVDGDTVELGRALVAPGDFHMAVGPGGAIRLERTPAIHGVRPAVDITMESAASVYRGKTVGVILTGMGRDGTSGALAVKRAGGTVISEHESTCVVYGMPRSVEEAGASDTVVPLDDVADCIVKAVSSGRLALGGASR